MQHHDRQLMPIIKEENIFPQGKWFWQVTGLEALHAGWAKVLANGGAAGGDGVDLRQFGEDAGLRLARLHRSLVAGTYAPGPLRRVTIPKRGGGQRNLAIPCVADRVAQCAAATVLEPRLDAEMEDASFGYRRGRSVRQAVDRVAVLRGEGYEWVVDADIDDYFDSVPHDKLLARFREIIDDERLAGLIGLWLHGFDDGGVGLPQGSPLSPLLANLYLDAVDETIESKGVRLVRFADDFVLLCRKQKTAEAALKRVAGLLSKQGLRLDPDKTRIVSFDQGFRFLGHLFVKSMVLRSRAEDPIDEPAAGPGWQKVHGPSPEDPATEESAPRRDRRPDIAAGPAAEPETEAPARRDLAPRVRPLYVVQPGRTLGLANQAFAVYEGDRPVLRVHHRQVDRIEIGPGVDVVPEALVHAAASDTELAFVDGRGATQALVSPPVPDRGRLHLLQAHHCLSPDLRIALARRIIEGRLHNQRALLYRLNRRRKDPEVREAARRIGRLIRRIDRFGSPDELRGLEGQAAALYWPSLGACLEHGWKLRRRRRRPPPDPVNLVLSWLSSLLYRDLSVLIQRHDLHPGFSVLHESQDGKAVCASDLIEALRAPLVEGLTVYLFNNRVLSRDNFSKHDDGAVVIDTIGRERVIREYERWLARPVIDPAIGEEVLWRGLMERQVVGLRAHVTDQRPFEPYRMDY